MSGLIYCCSCPLAMLFHRVCLLLTVILASVAHGRAGQDESEKPASKNVIDTPVKEARFYFKLGATGEFDEYHVTKFISDGTADFGAVGRFSLPARTQTRDFASAHDVATVGTRFSVGYVVNPTVSLFVGFGYSHNDGDSSRRLGSVTDVDGAFGAVGGRYDLYGDMGQYQSYAGFAGARLTLPRTLLNLLHAPRFISSYFSFSLGAKYLDGQHVRFYSGGVDAVNTTIQLYDSSVVFTSQGGFGYEFRLARNFSVELDTNYGYDTKPERGDTRLNGRNNNPFQGINQGGDRFFQQVSLSAKLRF